MRTTTSRIPFIATFLATAAVSAHAGQVCFYENYNYAGASYCTTATSGDITAPVIDKVSAVTVPAGIAVTLYQHAAFGGRSLVLTGNAPNLANLDFNNLTSSFRQAPPTATKIVFVGNSFTHGEHAPVVGYNAANVTDLNGSGYGGMPGIFKQLTAGAGLNYSVAIEAVSNQTLKYHDTNKLGVLASKSWDVVVLQEHSLLDPANPGNGASLATYSKLLEQYVHRGAGATANPAAKVYLLQTWARPDQVYDTPGGHWNGTSIDQMTADIHAAYRAALNNDGAILGAAPVGDAFLRAMVNGLADRNPYNGITAGRFNIWNGDNHHASVHGSYLEALVVFGKVTGVDPRVLGGDETAARALGLTSAQAIALQSVAYDQLLTPFD